MLPELEEIKRRRKALNLTQAELANLVGTKNVKRGTIGKLETKRMTPSYPMAKRIFDTLETLEKERMTGLRNITVKQIHNTKIEYVDVYDRIQTVCKLMEDKAFSQFPVKDKDKIVGSITEKGINMLFVKEEPKKIKSLLVSDVMVDPFPTVSVNTPVISIINLLQNYQAILTVEDNKIVGIITNQDVWKVYSL